MSVLFMDGFDHYGSSDILKKWDYIYSTTFSSINTSIKRNGTSSLRVKGSSGIYMPTTKSFTSSQTLVVGFAGYSDMIHGHFYLYFQDGAINHIRIDINPADNKISIARNTTVLGTSDAAIMSKNEWFYIEVKVYIHDTAGYVTIKKNGEVFYELTDIDTRNSANEFVTAISVGSTYEYFYIDDLYIDDAAFLGDIKVETLYPSGAGTTTQLTPSAGSNYECVDEETINDTDYVTSGTVNNIDTYAMGDIQTETGVIKAVQVSLVAKKDDAGSRSIAPILKPSDTDRVGDSVSLSDSYMVYSQVYNTNPDDSEAWEFADVNGMEIGVKVVG